VNLFKFFGFAKIGSGQNTSSIGIGLVIARKITEKIGGAITFESVAEPSLNHGSTFTFKFPLEDRGRLDRSNVSQNPFSLSPSFFRRHDFERSETFSRPHTEMENLEPSPLIFADQNQSQEPHNLEFI